MTKKTKKIIVVNPKGGSTKSTTAQQIAAPLLYHLSNKKVKLFEYDPQNQDSVIFVGKTAIFDPVICSKKAKLTENIIDFLKEESAVFDLGGNKAGEDCLLELSNLGALNSVNLILIPIMDGDCDCQCAKDTYDFIRSKTKTAKIVFVLGRVNDTSFPDVQYLHFLGDKGYYITGADGLLDSIPQDDRNYILVANDDCIKVAHGHGLTAYEVRNYDPEEYRIKSEQVLNEMLECSDEKKKSELDIKFKKLCKRVWLINRSKEFYRSTLNKYFPYLTDFL